MIAVVASMAYVMTGIQKSELETSDFSIQQAFAANPQNCSVNISDVENKKTFDYKIPTVLPTGYEIRDALVDDGVVGFFYASGEMCGPNATKKSFQDGVIQYITTDKTVNPERISNPESYFNQYKTNSDYPERIIIKKIAGQTAMMWEKGMEKNIYIDSDGKIIAEQEVPYPAQITIVDKDGERLYLVKGYATLDDLEKMIESAVLQG